MIERMSMRAGAGVADSMEDETMQVHGQRLDADVRWVTLPNDLGGGRATVMGQQVVECPCAADHEVIGLVLDRTRGGRWLMVIECGSSFLWTVAP